MTLPGGKIITDKIRLIPQFLSGIIPVAAPDNVNDKQSCKKSLKKYETGYDQNQFGEKLHFV
jgi:hypothetical protein